MNNKNLFSTFLSLAFICCLAITNPIEAQNISINADGTAPDNSAMLDISSTSSGLLIPRMTFLERTLILTPAPSLLIYQTNNTPGYYFNSGTAAIPVWVQLSTPPDNLGNHITTTNIQLGTNYLSGDGDNEGIYVNTTGNVGIGTALPSANLTVAGLGEVGLRVYSYASLLSDNSSLNLSKARGTEGSEASVVQNDIVGQVSALAYDGSAYGTAAKIQFEVDNIPGVGDTPGRIQFHTAADGASITTERMRITSDGNVGVGTAVPDSLFDVAGGAEIDRLSIAGNYTFPNTPPINNGDVIQYDGTNLIWGTSALQTLSSVLAAGKDAGADSIFNLNAMTIGTTRAPKTSLEIDSFFVVQGKPYNGFRWAGFNAYYDGVSADPQYLNDGTADLLVSGTDKMILGHWGTNTANSIVPSTALTSVELDTNISLLGNDPNFRVYIDGNLGVGTNSPLGKMEVAGDGSFIGGLRVSGTIGTTVGSSIYLDGATKDWTITATNAGAGAGNNKLIFRDYSSAADRVTIDGAGNVGIGTTAPAYLLDVNGSARVNNLRVNTANLQFGAAMEVANRANIIGAGSPNLFIGNSGANCVQLLYNSAGYGQLFTTGTNDIVLSAGGNVGIGTTAPSSELEVVGNIEIPAINNYTYSTAKTHYQSYAPTTFNSLLPDLYAYGTNAAADFYAYFRSGGAAFGYATVTVNLPDGATVTELQAWIYDNLATNPVRVSLHRQALGTSGFPPSMAEVESLTATATTAIQNLTDNTITFGTATIDNQNYAYFLLFTGRQNSTDSRLYGTKVTYTVTETD